MRQHGEKGDFAAWFVTRMGIFSVMLGMGTEAFSVALYENRPLIETILDRYVDWTCALADHAAALGFDVFVTTDDMAFKSTTFFSPKVFRELVLPRYHRLARHVTLPWVLHSDGNMLPFLDDLVKASPLKVQKILTDNGKEFTDRLFGSREKNPSGEHDADARHD